MFNPVDIMDFFEFLDSLNSVSIEENQNGESELGGYFSISKDPEKNDTYVLHNLCVKPQLRKQGYGRT